MIDHLPPAPLVAPEWCIAPGPVAYPEAVAHMEQRATAIASGLNGELFWLLEHPPLYTAGTSAADDELLEPAQFPVYTTGRGGRYTYHGPGQRIVYALCDLRQRDRDVRQHVYRLEEWIIRVLGDFGVDGARREGRIGIWVSHRGRDEKIAAIGVRVRQWVTYHGLALNVHPDLSHFRGIVPCGLASYGVTSLHDLGITPSMEVVDQAFKKHLSPLFGYQCQGEPIK